MNAGVVKPGQKDGAKVVEIAIPLPRRDEVIVKMLEAGIDGTDMEINGGGTTVSRHQAKVFLYWVTKHLVKSRIRALPNSVRAS